MVDQTAMGLHARDELDRRRTFERMMESFLNQWKPDDRREASLFEAQLHSLVRQIYTDAQEPVLDRFTKLAMSLPSVFPQSIK